MSSALSTAPATAAQTTRPEIVTAVVTPFDRRGELDLPAFRTLVEHVAPHVDGVFVGGTTGEFPAMDAAERIDITLAALDLLDASRTIAHVGAPSARQAKELLVPLRAAGVFRFAALTPYYLSASADGVRRYYGELLEALGAGAELYVYIFPEVAGTDVDVEQLAALKELGAAGVKISGGASARVLQYAPLISDEFRLWSGNDADLPRVASVHGTGTVSGVSGVAPQAFSALADALSDKSDRASDRQRVVAGLVAALGPSIARLKYGLDLLGLPGGATRMPIDVPEPAVRQQISSALTAAGLLD